MGLKFGSQTINETQFWILSKKFKKTQSRNAAPFLKQLSHFLNIFFYQFFRKKERQITTTSRMTAVSWKQRQQQNQSKWSAVSEPVMFLCLPGKHRQTSNHTGFVVTGYILRFGAGPQQTLMGDPNHVIMEPISCNYSINSPQTHCTLSAVLL